MRCVSRIALSVSCASLLAGVLLAGCTPELLESSTSRLPSLASLPHTLGLDVFFIERPIGDPLLGPELWESVDENFMSALRRQALKQNGLRIGIVGGHMPLPLETLLGLDGASSSPVPPAQSADQPGPAVDPGFTPVEKLTQGPWGRHLVLRQGNPSKIFAAGPLPECFILLDHNGVRGRRFTAARFLYDLRPTALSDSSVQLELHPEIQHGPARIQYEDALNYSSPVAQAVETFPHLACSATLTPGQMILMTMWPEAEQSLGWHFFTQQDDDTVKQRLIVVRVSKLPAADELFAER